MKNTILLGDSREEPSVPVVSPEAPPPPAPPEAPSPLEEWREGERLRRSSASERRKRLTSRELFAIVDVHDCDGETMVDVYESEEERVVGWHRMLDELRGHETPPLTYDELEARLNEETCHRVYFTRAILGGYEALKREARLRRHFERELEGINGR